MPHKLDRMTDDAKRNGGREALIYASSRRQALPSLESPLQTRNVEIAPFACPPLTARDMTTPPLCFFAASSLFVGAATLSQLCSIPLRSVGTQLRPVFHHKQLARYCCTPTPLPRPNSSPPSPPHTPQITRTQGDQSRKLPSRRDLTPASDPASSSAAGCLEAWAGRITLAWP